MGQHSPRTCETGLYLSKEVISITSGRRDKWLLMVPISISKLILASRPLSITEICNIFQSPCIPYLKLSPTHRFSHPHLLILLTTLLFWLFFVCLFVHLVLSASLTVFSVFYSLLFSFLSQIALARFSLLAILSLYFFPLYALDSSRNLCLFSFSLISTIKTFLLIVWWSCYVISLYNRGLLASASWGLGLNVCATMPYLIWEF